MKNIQLEVIKQWETEFGIKAEEINLELLAYSTLIWSNKMSSEPSAPSFAQELTEHEGEISPLWELLKWICYKQSDHTLPAIGLALFEKTVNTESSFHKVCTNRLQIQVISYLFIILPYLLFYLHTYF